MNSRVFQKNEFYLGIVIVVFAAVITIINPSFLTVENMFDLIKSSSGMAILAMGVFMVLLSGGIDVSFTAVAIAGQYIAVNTLIATGVDNLLLAFVVSCAVGAALGAINAVFISLLNLPTLITTLGTLSLFHGALLEFVGTKSINVGGLPDCFKRFGAFNLLQFDRADGTTYGLSVFVLLLAGVVVVTWLVLRFTVLGRGIYAIGGNYTAARRSGLNITGIQFFIYMYVGLLAGIMGVMQLSLIQYSNPNYIVGTELSVIAAVVIGGARITGGSGSILGTLLGVVLIVILEKNLVLLGLSSYWQQLFVGLIIIVGVSATYIQNRIRSGRSSLVVT